MTPSELVKEHGSIKAAAEAAGVKYHTFYARYRKELNAATPNAGSPAPSNEDAEGVAATGEQA